MISNLCDSGANALEWTSRTSVSTNHKAGDAITLHQIFPPVYLKSALIFIPLDILLKTFTKLLPILECGWNWGKPAPMLLGHGHQYVASELKLSSPLRWVCLCIAPGKWRKLEHTEGFPGGMACLSSGSAGCWHRQSEASTLDHSAVLEAPRLNYQCLFCLKHVFNLSIFQIHTWNVKLRQSMKSTNGSHNPNGQEQPPLLSCYTPVVCVYLSNLNAI